MGVLVRPFSQKSLDFQLHVWTNWLVTSGSARKRQPGTIAFLPVTRSSVLPGVCSLRRNFGRGHRRYYSTSSRSCRSSHLADMALLADVLQKPSNLSVYFRTTGIHSLFLRPHEKDIRKIPKRCMLSRCSAAPSLTLTSGQTFKQFFRPTCPIGEMPTSLSSQT